MSALVNPKTITVTDASVAAQSVSSFVLSVGTATGGPYTAATATVPVASFTAEANGAYSIAMANVAFTPPLSSFTTYFMVAEADNSAGASGGSPEVSFQIVSVPTAPTALALA